MPDTDDRKCPECGGSMKDIEIIDKTVLPPYLPEQTSLEYAVPGGKRSFWTGSLPVEGKVSALMCDGCGRILLFGRPGGG